MDTLPQEIFRNLDSHLRGSRTHLRTARATHLPTLGERNAPKRQQGTGSNQRVGGIRRPRHRKHRHRRLQRVAGIPVTAADAGRCQPAASQRDLQEQELDWICHRLV